MTIRMQKVHGSENDFFLIDEMQLKRTFTEKELDDLRRVLCDRKTGLLGGADGLLLVEQSLKATPLAKMRVINSDGSEASMCGNGLRTVARYLAEKYQKQSFVVETKFTDLNVQQAPVLAENVATYQVEISPVSFEAAAIPMKTNATSIVNEVIPELSHTLNFSVLAVPNPHLIAFVDHETLFSEEFERIATYVNGDQPLFPEGINVSFVEVLEDNRLFVRTFERGVGFTNACGTAMCASSLMHVLLHKGQFEQPIIVQNMGGMVQTIVHNKENHYWMELIGNATITHQLTGDLSDFLKGNVKKITIHETGEQAYYSTFLKTINLI